MKILFRGVVVAVAAGIVFGLGVVYGNHHGEKERRGVNDENEEGRRENWSFLAQFEVEIFKMEDVIRDVAMSPPTTEAEFIDLLRFHGLAPEQIQRIVNATPAYGVYPGVA